MLRSCLSYETKFFAGMTLVQTIRHVLFLLVILEVTQAYTNALVSGIESRTSGDGANDDIVSCGKNCTKGGKECPEDCFCGIYGSNIGHCYKVIENFPANAALRR
uniref:Evasin n=1 Tax=Rhipicephalus zambeziensis TaxID=60191 RepID=A0A224YCC6_9ACAR